MGEKTLFYRVIPDCKNFASKDFQELDEAQKYITNYENGCPDNKEISEDNRNYWKEYGKQLKLYEIQETKTLIS